MKVIPRLNNILLVFFLISSTAFLVWKVIWQNLYIFSNSDLLFIPAFLNDFWEGHYNWREWNLPPSPYLFPDLFFSFLVSLLTQNLFISFLIYSISFSFLIVIGLTMIIHPMDEYFSFQRILRVTTFFIAFWIILVSNYPEDLALFIFPSYHGSSFIFGLIFYRIIFQIDNINKIIAFILLSGLVISSDTQIVYTFYIPFLLTSIFLKSALPEKLYIKVFIYFVVSFVVGSFFLKLLGSINIFSVPSIPVWKEIKMNIFQLKILENIRNITPVVKVYFMELYSDKILFFYLLIVSVPLNLYYAFKKTEVKTELRFFSLYVLLVLFVSIFTQMFFGIWGGARYVWAIYFFPYVSILIYFGNSLSRMLTNGNYRKVEGMRKYVFLLSKDRIRSQLILFGIVIIFLVLFIFMYLIKGRVELTVSQPYPPFVSCLDELKKKYDLTYGISDYWNAKHVSYLSKEKLFVNQVFVNLEKYNWINNRDWYKRDKENQSIHYHFILPERLDINRIKEKFGSDYKTEICEGREVFVFEKGFYY